MSRLYASIDADASKTQATRRGHRNIETHTRGWEQGIRVVARITGDGRETFEVYVTGGSNGATHDKLVYTMSDGDEASIVSPGEYNSDDLDKLVIERDREAGR